MATATAATAAIGQTQAAGPASLTDPPMIVTTDGPSTGAMTDATTVTTDATTGRDTA